MMDRRIGAQYFTLREYTKTVKDFEESCRKVHEMGYKIVQISGTPLEAREMRPILDDYELKVVTTHRGFDDFLNCPEQIMEYNRTLGCELCGVGSMPKSYWGSAEGATRFIEDAGRVAELLKKEGLYFGYHNHALEFAKFDGVFTMDRLLDETDPEAFKFIVDTYWLQFAGIDPAKYIRKIGERAWAVHFKDLAVDPDSHGKVDMAEVGQGNLDWDEIIEACEEAGVKWALVEQDICKRDPFESLKMSYDYLTAKGFI